ncbi:hypothetical protein IM725_16965 [Ramlibacter aquaticus]|uniref:Uncharacterized protein n=2 Tax=Ramlibacter TaxID=174951 RepID=A0ABR9SIT5_9BURK|nr:hypothetical protein [Ramlibacter aquaticus]MBE7942265.1 hypothetical protein [Ramlibacter aquaticus]
MDSIVTGASAQDKVGRLDAHALGVVGVDAQRRISIFEDAVPGASNDQAFELVREELLSVHNNVLSELEATK